MANPYHDAEGKFCSKNEMKAAYLELGQKGDLDGYFKLRYEYEEIERNVLDYASLDNLNQQIKEAAIQSRRTNNFEDFVKVLELQKAYYSHPIIVAQEKLQQEHDVQGAKLSLEVKHRMPSIQSVLIRNYTPEREPDEYDINVYFPNHPKEKDNVKSAKVIDDSFTEYGISSMRCIGQSPDATRIYPYVYSPSLHQYSKLGNVNKITDPEVRERLLDQAQQTYAKVVDTYKELKSATLF